MSDLIIHLELQFESWMNWKNWGKYNPKIWNDNDQSTWTWNIDHIKPKSWFDIKKYGDNEFLECWSLNNLRPYSSKQNIIDNDRKKQKMLEAA